MYLVAAIALCALYFAGVLVGAPLIGPDFSWAFLAAWSVAFVWFYRVFLHGRAFAAVSIVIVVTIVLPLVALIVVAWPALDFVWPALQDRGVPGGLAFFAPLIAALIGIFVARRTAARFH